MRDKRAPRPKQGPCDICWRENIVPEAPGDLVRGVRWTHDGDVRRAWEGYACDMHLSDDSYFEWYEYI